MPKLPQPCPVPDNRQKFLVEDPIYTEYDVSNVSSEDLVKLLRSEDAIDAYCPICKRTSVFRVEGIGYGFDNDANKIGRYSVTTIEARCNRRGEWRGVGCFGRLFVCFYRHDDTLIKIGQYPSKATGDFGTLDPAFKELDEGLRRELGTAIGLHAYGVGVGSFVYLRRIFESLVEEAHERARQEEDWDEATFQRSRMNERIQQLHATLPSRLVQTSSLYGILSKGIHELTEEECINHFPLVFQAIQMILKERHENREYDKVARALQKEGKRLLTSTTDQQA
jgi:hypothetical protein